jgi:hypothetical protein
MEIPNENYWEEKRRQREKNSSNAPSPSSPPIYYVLHGGGMFVESRHGERFMRFDNLEQTVNSHAIVASRERFFMGHGGYLKSERLSDRHNLSPDLSNIIQEQIDHIRRLGGTVFLSQTQVQLTHGYSSLYFYFQSDSFRDTNE